jgi:hypothetical protein
LAKKKNLPEFWIRGLGLKTFSLIQVEEMETSPDFAAKYAHHLQRARERQTKYYYENADSRRDYAKDYYQRNKELRLQQAKERYQLKKALAAAAAITSEEE